MTPALSIRDLRKTYKGGFEALKGIDLDVQQGDFFALLGANGAGKSTTIGIVTSLVNKTSGTVEVFGHNLDSELSAAKTNIGLVPQEFNFNQFEPVEEICINQGGYYGLPRHIARQRSEKYLKQLGLWEKRRSEARNLSGGMKRRLMIARAMIHEPRMLILDEPTAGVDIEIRHAMWQFMRDINAQGTTIILTTHYLEEAESLCRNIAIIDAGRIRENTSMRQLLKTLSRETFVLELASPVFELPKDNEVELTRIDDDTLEVCVDKSLSLNRVFEYLNQHGIEVNSLRQKSNRLEQLFLDRVSAGREVEA